MEANGFVESLTYTYNVPCNSHTLQRAKIHLIGYICPNSLGVSLFLLSCQLLSALLLSCQTVKSTNTSVSRLLPQSLMVAGHFRSPGI